jgi:hypothetical protein
MHTFSYAVSLDPRTSNVKKISDENEEFNPEYVSRFEIEKMI